MTSDTTEAPRANHLGDPCPTWCTSDHTLVLMTMSSGRVVHDDSHRSDPMGGRWPTPEVHVTRRPDGTWVSLLGHGVNLAGPEALSAEQAEQLATLLEVVGANDGGMMSDDLRAAAAIAREEA